MKKTIITAFLILALVLSSGINARAFAGTDFKIHTRASVSDYFSETSYANIVKNIYSYVGNQSSISGFYSLLNGLPASAFNYDNYILFRRNGYLRLVCFNGSSILVCSNNNIQSSMLYDNVETNWYTYLPVVNGGYSYTTYQQTSNNTWEGTGTDVVFSGSYYALYLGGVLLDTNLDLYYFDELVMKSIPHTDVVPSNLFSFPDLYGQLTVLNNNIPYVDGEGSIIDPTPVIESNANHLYFQSCDLGFCEPVGITNFESFGGAYLFCKYSVDNWIVNHINDYQLRFNVVAAIGSEQNNFSYTMRLDRNGYVTVPFSSLFVSNSSSAIPVNRGFAAVVSSQKLNNDYNIAHLYSVANENVPNFVSDVLDAEYNYNLTDLGWSALRGGVLKYIVAWVSDQGTISMNNVANWAEGVTQSFNPYILRVEVKLISGEDQSSGYAEKFDFYTGDQTTVDTGGLVNPDPFVPDVDQDDGDLPSGPQDPNSTTPSTIIYTGGTFTGNFNGSIGFDPGYRELKEDVDNDSDGNFTQYLDPMHNTSVGAWFMSFVDAMPAEMKALLIAGTGVGIFFGLYRFIRRG